ncbi:protein of unknown function [Nitrosotalea devaniterrae]|uniref:Uncharacterized protein n=1 Tax=Nitrosotalea devaniterrae TaxID=1078905 RepID=A0A128A465_9ARCH|nr:protein of unknown function [Candidatus Nitrosotalea devanaterra]
MVKLSLVRGPLIAVIGLIVLVLGANLFDMVYQSVEPLLGSTSDIFTDREILPSQFINSTVDSGKLKEHNVIIVHTMPSTGSVKLEGIDPNGMTFEKESKDGFLYHIIQRSNQGGPYLIKVLDTGNQPVRITAIMGEDPFLSNNCNTTYGIKCNMVQISVGMVVIGIVALVVGVAISAYDFKKESKQKSNSI